MTDRERNKTGAAPEEGGSDPREARLRALFAAADPTTVPPELLQQRVAAMAAEHAGRTPRRGTVQPRPRWTPWRIALGLAAATALALISVSLAPMWVAAQVLRRAEAAAGEVRNAHVVTWTIGPHGSRRKTREEWEQGARSRTLDLGGERIQWITDGRIWTYEPKLNNVTVQRLPSTPAHEPSGYTLKEIVHRGWGDQVWMLSDTFVKGQRFHQVAIQRAGWRERSLLRVDATTDLPIEGEGQLELDGRWVTQNVTEVRYNELLPAGWFQPHFPKTAQILDVDHGRQEWEKRLSHGIARQQVGDRTLVIRDIQVNAEGDLFLLYTAGKYLGDSLRTNNRMAGRDWNLEVKDDLGTFYEAQSGNWASNPGMPPGFFKGYIFNGERLEGDWWIPAVPQSPWKPRRFTLTFRANPVNLHGNYNDPGRKSVYTETAVFTLPVAAPATELVPDYMPYMASGFDAKGDEIRRSRARARAFYYRYEQPDLPRALEYYREAIRLDEEQARETGQRSIDSETWRDIGEVLRELGRKEEAREALQEAVRAALYPDSVRQGAEEALEALNGDIAWSVGRPAPSFTATDLNGQPQSPERYRGQVLLIDLWATWDEKSRAELSTLKALYDQYSGKGLAIVGIGLDWHTAVFRQFVKERALPWPQVHEEKAWGGPLHRSFGSPKPPYTILIDRQGTIRALDLHGPALEKAVAALLAGG
jgi:tetratricopeptide (TPR) repeat protein